MAPLVFVVFLLVAVALIVVSLRALVVAVEAMRLTYRLKLLARVPPEQARLQNVSAPLTPLPSCYPPIRVLYSTEQPSPARD